jgi:glucan 1,3-beta-glucosidase
MSAVGTVYGVANGTEVGSVIFIDSIISNTPIGIKTSRVSGSYPPIGAGLAIRNVVFTNVPTAIRSLWCDSGRNFWNNDYCGLP